MRNVVWVLFVLLLVVHHDFWNWHTVEPLVFGYIPIGLAYHVGISAAAGVLWALAVKFCWPRDVDDIEETQPAGDPHA